MPAGTVPRRFPDGPQLYQKFAQIRVAPKARIIVSCEGRFSCHGACREPKAGMTRRRLTKVEVNVSQRKLLDRQFDLQVKTTTRHSSGGTPRGKPPWFVVARSAPKPFSRHSCGCSTRSALFASHFRDTEGASVHSVVEISTKSYEEPLSWQIQLIDAIFFS